MKPDRSILVVDDDANLRSTLTMILQRAGYDARSAADGRDALRCLNETRFDLLFLDLKMPGMDGLELLPEVHRLYPELPVLILTASASVETAVEALRMGANGYLLKPVDPEQIISRAGSLFQEQTKQIRRQQIMGEIKGIINELSELES